MWLTLQKILMEYVSVTQVSQEMPVMSLTAAVQINVKFVRDLWTLIVNSAFQEQSKSLVFVYASVTSRVRIALNTEELVPRRDVLPVQGQISAIVYNVLRTLNLTPTTNVFV